MLSFRTALLLLAPLMLLSRNAEAIDIIEFRISKDQAAHCEYAALSKLSFSTKAPWAEDLFRFASMRVPAVSSTEFMEIAQRSGEKHGLVIVVADFDSTYFFYAHIGASGSLLASRMVGGLEGNVPDGSAKLSFFDAKRHAVEETVEHVTYRITDKPELVFWSDGQAPFKIRKSSFSRNGQYLAAIEGSSLVVRTVQGSLVRKEREQKTRDENLWVDSVSDDGRFVSVISGAMTNAASSVVIDMNEKTEVYNMRTDTWGYPRLQFFDKGFTALYRNRVELYEGRRHVATYAISDLGEPDVDGVETVTLPMHARYNPIQDRLLIFFHGPRPATSMSNPQGFFTGMRTGATEPMDNVASLIPVGSNLLEWLASETYQGLADGDFAVSGDWRFTAQRKTQGSGSSLSFKNEIYIATSSGKRVAVISPFYSTASMAFSNDGTLFAVAEQFNSPTPNLDKSKRIWIYSTQNLTLPIYTINDINLLRVDRMTFAADGSGLYLESANDGKAFRVELPVGQ